MKQGVADELINNHTARHSIHHSQALYRCCECTYNRVKVDLRVVHQALGNLGHNHIQAEEHGHDGGDDQVRDAEYPELAPTIELWWE